MLKFQRKSPNANFFTRPTLFWQLRFAFYYICIFSSNPDRFINFTSVGAYCIRPELRRFAILWRRIAVRLTRLCTGRMPYAPTYIQLRTIIKSHRSYNWRKTQAGKTAWDMGKIMSDVIFPTSDIIQTTSDLFSTLASARITETYVTVPKSTQSFAIQHVTPFPQHPAEFILRRALWLRRATALRKCPL